MKVDITATAESHLEDGFVFYEEQEQGAGRYFFDCLGRDIDSLAKTGGIHAVHLGYHRVISSTHPYSIYYSVHEDTVLVRAVVDSRRRPAWIRRTIRNLSK